MVVVLVACAAPPPAPREPPTPKVTVAAPWVVQSVTADAVLLRAGDGADGVRVQLARDERGRVPGVSPIARGRTLEVEDGDDRWPLVAVAFPDRALSVEIESDGVDVVARFAGPPLREVTDDAEAPADPVLTWVRLRPRGDSWRVVADGIATWSLPGGATGAAAADGTVHLTTAVGAVELSTDAPRSRSTDDGVRWSWSTAPSLAAKAPYPRTGLTIRLPVAEPGRSP